MIKRLLGLIAVGTLSVIFTAPAGGVPPQENPHQAEITNGQIRAKVFLPDGHKSFYQGTRFDGAGIVS